MSTYQPERLSARSVNITSRFRQTNAVVASPSGATETIIASLTLPGNVQAFTGIELRGWAAFTVGTNGVSGQLRIRQTNAAGQIIADSGALTAVATNLYASSVVGANLNTDATPPVSGGVYVLTLTVASGSAASTVSAVYLSAVVI